MALAAALASGALLWSGSCVRHANCGKSPRAIMESKVHYMLAVGRHKQISCICKRPLASPTPCRGCLHTYHLYDLSQPYEALRCCHGMLHHQRRLLELKLFRKHRWAAGLAYLLSSHSAVFSLFCGHIGISHSSWHGARKMVLRQPKSTNSLYLISLRKKVIRCDSARVSPGRQTMREHMREAG